MVKRGRAPRNGVGDGEGPSPAQHLLVVEGAKPRTAASEMERGRAPRSSVADGGAEPHETNMEWSGRGRAPRIEHMMEGAEPHASNTKGPGQPDPELQGGGGGEEKAGAEKRGSS